MKDQQRAYSLFKVKEIDDSRRVFKGIATTPAVDRVGDTIDPKGAQFTNPLTLLHQHDHRLPIGKVRFKKPTTAGIEFEAEMPIIEEEGALKERVDTAWGEIKYDLVRAVSIGFSPIKYAFKDDGGIEFQEIEIYELSTVSVPANAQAIITEAKSMTPDLARQLKGMDTGEKSGAIKLSRQKPKSKNAIKLKSK